eukprot:1696330-Alexandrium_andersonii.AAC.1
MVTQGWAVRREDLSSLRAQLGARELPVNRLALVSKLGPDNLTKHRVAWGPRRSLVNGLARQGERIVLPRISD